MANSEGAAPMTSLDHTFGISLSSAMAGAVNSQLPRDEIARVNDEYTLYGDIVVAIMLPIMTALMDAT